MSVEKDKPYKMYKMGCNRFIAKGNHIIYYNRHNIHNGWVKARYIMSVLSEDEFVKYMSEEEVFLELL